MFGGRGEAICAMTCASARPHPKKRRRFDDLESCPVVENALDKICKGADWTTDGRDLLLIPRCKIFICWGLEAFISICLGGRP
jgi:hypothetical protein